MTKNANKTNYSRVCDALPQLTEAELEQVRLRLNHLSKGGTQSSPKRANSSTDDDWLLAGIETELRRRGLLGRGHLPAPKIVNGWAETSATVRANVVRFMGGGDVDRRECAALGTLLGRVLADYVTHHRRLTVSPRTLLQAAPAALTALDAAFPGYAEAGLLRCCLDPEALGDAA